MMWLKILASLAILALALGKGIIDQEPNLVYKIQDMAARGKGILDQESNLVYRIQDEEDVVQMSLDIPAPSHQSTFMAKVLKFAHTVNSDPELKDLWDEQVAISKNPSIRFEPPIPPFTCDTSETYPYATNVNALRVKDIKVIAAMGDSISAGNGLGAEGLLAVAVQNRGEVWDVGGDFSLEDKVITIANVLKKYTPDLKGPSVCTGGFTNAKKSWLNLAEPGGDAGDMNEQARYIVDRAKADTRIDFQNDWKMVTLFIGGNDFCGACDERDPDWIDPGRTPTAWGNDIRLAVDIFEAELPRAIINLVSMFDITPLNVFNDTLCTLSHWLFCDCVITNTTYLSDLHQGYHEQLAMLSDGRYDRDDFAVVNQPMFYESSLPYDEAGLPDRSFLSPDCFHPGRGAHQGFAFTLWNTLFIPVGQKPTDVMELSQEWFCPTKDDYIATNGNSLPRKKSA